MQQRYSQLRRQNPGMQNRAIESLVKKQRQEETNKRNTSGQVTGERGIEVKVEADIAPLRLRYNIDQPIRMEVRQLIPMEERQQSPEEQSNRQTRIGRSTATKSIRKPSKKQQQYYSFVKIYYRKLHIQHPRWNRDQINQIIKLLWRKNCFEKSQNTLRIREKLLQRINTRIFKPKTGRKLYGDKKRQQCDMHADEIQNKWNRLPRQTRRYFASLGINRQSFENNYRPRVVLPSRSRVVSNVQISSIIDNLGFMRNFM